MRCLSKVVTYPPNNGADYNDEEDETIRKTDADVSKLVWQEFYICQTDWHAHVSPGHSPGILHIAICAKPPPNPVIANPAVK